jgi:hypothetical protein
VCLLRLDCFLPKGYTRPTASSQRLNHFTETTIHYFSRALWSDYFKVPVYGRKYRPEDILDQIQNYFMRAKWFEIYDFLEFVLKYFPEPDLTETLNRVLERELAGYRIINGIISPITGELRWTGLSRHGTGHS